MKRMVFMGEIYWDIHWMYPVIKAMDGEVYVTSDHVKSLCQSLGLKTVETLEPYQILVETIYHMGERHYKADYFLNTGGQVVLLQHAWDPSLHLKDGFWNWNMGRFSHFLVGCTQDYQWLSDKYGQDKIHLTGIPRLDILKKVKDSRKSLEPIYQEVGHRDFFLANAPTDVLSKGVYQKYAHSLPGDSPLPVVYKIHPGQSAAGVRGGLPSDHQITLVEDNQEDLEHTYRLIKASRGVVALESFMLIEASLLEKPVIFYAREELPPDLYNRQENVNQIYRAPVEMSSTLAHPEFTPRQKEIADMYLFDGQNTLRVVEFLNRLCQS